MKTLSVKWIVVYETTIEVEDCVGVDYRKAKDKAGSNSTVRVKLKDLNLTPYSTVYVSKTWLNRMKC